MAISNTALAAATVELARQYKAEEIDEAGYATGLAALWVEANSAVPALGEKIDAQLAIKADILTAWQAALNVKGQVAAVSGLPAEAEDRDAYQLVNPADPLDGHLFTRVAGVWTDIGPLGGERGASAFDVAVKVAEDAGQPPPADEAAFVQELRQPALDAAETATTAASNADAKATLANDKAALADAKATLANDKAALADAKATLAQAKADYAQEQGDAAAGVVAGAATILEAVPLAEAARDAAEAGALIALAATIKGANVKLFEPGEDDAVIPFFTDQNDGVLFGVDVETGFAAGSLVTDIYDKAETLTANAGSAMLYDPEDDIVPFFADDDDGVLFGVDKATGQAKGSLVDDILSRAGGLPEGDGVGAFNYDSYAEVQPIIGDAADGVYLGVNRITGEPVGLMPEKIKGWIGDAVDGISLPTSGALPTAIRPVLANINGGISYGQSGSVGAQGQNAISTNQPYYNLTFTGGPKAAVGSGTATSKPLVEDNLQEAGAAGGNRGETPCSGLANYCVQLAAEENGIDPASIVFFSSAPGQGSQRITALNKGTTYYTRFLGHVQAAKDLASAAGKTYALHAVAWIQGESDADNVVARATYRDLLVQLAADIDADVRAITGQASPVHLLTYQTPFQVVSSGGKIALAQLDAVDLGDLIHFVTPYYHLPYYSGDSTHLINTGYLLSGRYFGRALKQLVIDGKYPDCIRAVRAVAKGTTLTVKFSVPRAPLVLDTTQLAATTDMGFKVLDDTGTLTLSGITVVDGDTVQITLNRALGANPKVRYALDYLGTGLTILQGASGNLRDSTPMTTKISGTAYPMFHVAPASELSILKLDPNS
jgi:hypothetical protein